MIGWRRRSNSDAALDEAASVFAGGAELTPGQRRLLLSAINRSRIGEAIDWALRLLVAVVCFGALGIAAFASYWRLQPHEVIEIDTRQWVCVEERRYRAPVAPSRVPVTEERSECIAWRQKANEL